MVSEPFRKTARHKIGRQHDTRSSHDGKTNVRYKVSIARGTVNDR